ncbi:hypothetical protein [Geochorda subterranea]|uniref:Uncharacterized protein n=1 Tax=Geochorda subterranea TaxID=3109564 RepID=A0ABZ1BSD3_9FIRM|nr:hypothetical protein [Limnochorda sp. LNt]WRP15664.1 hypothetical protein VLY81_05750 [Limnochorda sp. LNt]
MLTDPEPVRARLALLAEYLGDLEAVQDASLEQFLADKKLRRYVERTLGPAARWSPNEGDARGW